MILPAEIALTTEKQQQVRELLTRARKLSQGIELVRACKVDCSGYDALRAELISILEAMATNFVKPGEI